VTEGAPHLRVVDVAYFKSGPTCEALGPAVAPEVAFIGRSNVGKSSLLNALTKTKLVRTSKTPGQTRSVNLFSATLGRVGRSGDITERRPLVLADLPGYGFAKASKEERTKLSRLLSHYLGERQGLVAVVHLVDARHVPSAQDREVYEEVASLDVAHILVATKADKLRAQEKKAAAAAVTKPFGLPSGAATLFSSETGLGRDALVLKLWEHLGNVAAAAKASSSAPPATGAVS
jgi:GTP-binding protein